MILTVHRWFAATACPGSWMMNRMADLAKQVTAVLQGGASSGSATGTVSSTELYRVRKTWSDTKTQKGAYKNLDNAKACADKNPGWSVFNSSGKSIYSSKEATKTVDELAREVINGKWGNGADRKKRLTAAGYDYNAVQRRVNELLK